MSGQDPVEIIARSLYEHRRHPQQNSWDSLASGAAGQAGNAAKNAIMREAQAALSALKAQGMVVVPRDLPSAICHELAWHFDNDIVAGSPRSVKSLWEDAIAALKEKP